MPQKPLRASAGLAHLLRDARSATGLTLKQVSERCRRLGEPIPPATLVRIEQGMTDPGALRFHTLLRVFDIPPQVAADALDLESVAEVVRADRPFDQLLKDGIAAFKAGETNRALGLLAAAREKAPDTQAGRVDAQRATLTFAIAARNMNRFQLAHRLVLDVLCAPAEPQVIVHALTEAGIVARHLGSLESCIAFLDRAATLAAAGDDLRLRAVIDHARANALLERGEEGRALALAQSVIATFEAQGEAVNALKARLTRSTALAKLGRFDDAIAETAHVREAALQSGRAELAALAGLEQSRILFAARRLPECRTALDHLLAYALDAGDRTLEFLAHFWRAREARASGEEDRAEADFKMACHLVRFVHEVGPEIRDVRDSLRGKENHERSRPSPVTPR